MDVNILELGERIEQLSTEIAFRKKNGLDATDLEKELTLTCVQGLLATSTEPDIRPGVENEWEYVEYLDDVTPGKLVYYVTGFTECVQKAWDRKDYRELDRLLEDPFMSVYLLCAGFFTDERIGNEGPLDLTARTYFRNPESPEEAVQWIPKTYANLMENMKRVPETVWLEEYRAGAQSMCNAICYATEVQSYMEAAGLTKAGA
jgi:hypothetical protein